MNIPNIKIDKMRYQTNSLSYVLVMLSVVFSLIALFTLITYDSYGKGKNPLRVVPDYRIGLEIALAITLLLVTFLAAEKVKYYDRFWSNYGLFILAGINFFRIFNIPLYADKKGWIPNQVMINSIIEFIISVVLMLLAGIIAMRKVNLLKNYMKEIDDNGTSVAK